MGIGLPWPSADWAISGLINLYVGVAASALVRVCQGLHRKRTERVARVQHKGAETWSFGAIGAVAREF